MTTALLILLFIGVLLLVAVIFLTMFRASQRLEERLIQQNQSVQTQLLEMSRQMNQQLSQNASVVQDYTRVMGEFQNRLGQLQESTQSMIRIGQDISSLQDILQAPKLRGILGEYFLEELLKQILPQDRYVLQHSFRSGEKVDAVILLAQGMVPVDSKFPLENFRKMIQKNTSEEESRRNRKQFYQDVKKHIDNIATKYILPEEGTFDFALMYLPAENVYYEVIMKEEAGGDGASLVQYALDRKVIPVSPNTFYAYLQAIVVGLRGLRIENSAREILKCLGQLAGDFKKFYDEFETLGRHLNNSKSAFDKAQRRLDRFQDQLGSIESQDPTPALPESISPS